MNDKAPSVRLPRDYMRKTVDFDLVENGMKLVGERNGDTSAAAFVLFLYGVIPIIRVIVIIVNNKVPVVHLRSLSRLLGLAAALGARLFSVWLIAR